jgi:hypothetical protein
MVLVGGMLAGGLAALAFGPSYEWDMRNYHLYNPHALLTGRLLIDLAPAQLQTFLNPLFDIPAYLAFRFLHPNVWVFFSGAAQGALLFLLWRLIHLLGERKLPPWAALMAAALGLIGPVSLNEIGGMQGDTVLSVLALGGLLLLLGSQAVGEDKHGARAVLLGGFLLGLATALKLTFAIYAIALGVALLACGTGAGRWKQSLVYGCGTALGFLLGGGAWFAHLWIEYQNPFFPYFNQVFTSPWAHVSSFRDLRFMPVSISDWLLYPFAWWLDPYRVWELSFRDLRVVALYPAVIAFLLLGWRKARSEAPRLLLVCVFLAVSYILWLQLFSIYRYLAVVELLAPGVILALACFAGWPRRWLGVMALLLVCSQFLVEYPRSPSARKLVPDQASTLSTLPKNSLVVIDGYEPVAFTIFWLDTHIPVVRTRSNLMTQDPPQGRLLLEAERRVREHSGPIYLLHSAAERDAPFLPGDLSRLGLKWRGLDSCQPVFVDESLQNETGILICALERVPTPTA